MKLFLGTFVFLTGCSGILGKNYYFQNKTRLDWFDAYQNCRAQGLQLATINSKNEQVALEKAIEKAGVQTLVFWIGANDLSKEGSWVWMATGEPLVYKNFLPHQPDNDKGKEHCMDIWPDIRYTSEWNDAPCNHNKFFICEDQPKNCFNNEDIEVVCERVRRRK